MLDLGWTMIGLTPEKIIQSGGVLLIGGIIFAESAFLIGILLPGGDTLLFMAGFFASQGLLPIGWLIFTIVAAAILGDNVGYSIGRRAGPRIFKKDDGLFLRRDHVERAEKFYQAHGGKTVTLARFLPVIRTLAPVIAGAAKMDRKRFMFYNVIGAIGWGVSLPLLGYVFGSRIPNIDRYIVPVALLALIITFVPPLIPVLRNRQTRQNVAIFIRQRLRRILRYITLNKKID